MSNCLVAYWPNILTRQSHIIENKLKIETCSIDNFMINKKLHKCYCI